MNGILGGGVKVQILVVTFLIIFGLLWSGTSWAQANFCTPTGNETVAVDKEHYKPGEAVQVSGTGT